MRYYVPPENGVLEGMGEFIGTDTLHVCRISEQRPMQLAVRYQHVPHTVTEYRMDYAQCTMLRTGKIVSGTEGCWVN
jgi:hypothetical protein